MSLPIIRDWVQNIRVVDDRLVDTWYYFIGTRVPAK
jgi:hypothetical protein